VTQTLSQLSNQFDWNTVGCFIDSNNYIFSITLNQWIGRITSTGLEDRRFTARGQFSVMNNPSDEIIQQLTSSMDSNVRGILSLRQNCYKPWWSTRDAIIKDFIQKSISVENIDALNQRLIEFKEGCDNKMRSLEERHNRLRKIKCLQEPCSNTNRSKRSRNRQRKTTTSPTVDRNYTPEVSITDQLLANQKPLPTNKDQLFGYFIQLNNKKQIGFSHFSLKDTKNIRLSVDRLVQVQTYKLHNQPELNFRKLIFVCNDFVVGSQLTMNTISKQTLSEKMDYLVSKI